MLIYEQQKQKLFSQKTLHILSCESKFLIYVSKLIFWNKKYVAKTKTPLNSRLN